MRDSKTKDRERRQAGREIYEESKDESQRKKKDK
jgi:hypothetical protein